MLFMDSITCRYVKIENWWQTINAICASENAFINSKGNLIDPKPVKTLGEIYGILGLPLPAAAEPLKDIYRPKRIECSIRIFEDAPAPGYGMYVDIKV